MDYFQLPKSFREMFLGVYPFESPDEKDSHTFTSFLFDALQTRLCRFEELLQTEHALADLKDVLKSLEEEAGNLHQIMSMYGKRWEKSYEEMALHRPHFSNELCLNKTREKIIIGDADELRRDAKELLRRLEAADIPAPFKIRAEFQRIIRKGVHIVSGWRLLDKNLVSITNEIYLQDNGAGD